MMGLLEEQLKGKQIPKAKAAPKPSGLLPMEAPKYWTEEAMERDGKAKFFGKMLLGGFTGLGPLLFPESIGAKARYASDLELYQKHSEMAMVDPQDQALADAIMNGTVGPELMALQVMAGGVDKLNGSGNCHWSDTIRRFW